MDDYQSNRYMLEISRLQNENTKLLERVEELESEKGFVEDQLKLQIELAPLKSIEVKCLIEEVVGWKQRAEKAEAAIAKLRETVEKHRKASHPRVYGISDIDEVLYKILDEK